MTSCDTNVLYLALNADAVGHDAAWSFLASQRANQRFVLCELVLAELYCLLRNPAVSGRALDAATAAGVIQQLRSNPAWRLVDVPGDARIMDAVWAAAAQPGMAFRRLFDLRLAATLRHHGVREFATRNLRDFTATGFARVWDPTAL
ncbi:MAG: TA system VapC family ribonuclease toxin [bacterium]